MALDDGGLKKWEMMKEKVAAFKADCKAVFDRVEAADVGEPLGDEVEFEVRRIALRRYGAVYQAAVTFRGKEWERRPAPRCACGAKLRMVRRMPRQIVGLLGELRFTRRHYYCDACGVSRWPFDEEMGIDGNWTPGAVRLITRAGARESFAEAQTSLAEFAEIHSSSETVRRITESVAFEVATAQESGRLQGEESGRAFGRSEADGTDASVPDRAYVSMDGTMVNTLGGWREAKLGALYDQFKALQHYAGTFEPAGTFGLMVRRHAQGLRFGRAAEKIAGGDGAEWIWKQIQINFPTVHEEFLDFYHLSEKIYATAWDLYGESSTHGERWAKDKLRIVKDHGGRALLKTLRRSRQKWKKGTHRDALAALVRYVGNHVTRMDYPRLRQLGIDIGTGPQESACKNVVGARLKGRGMRWDVTNAEAMLRLRCLLCSTGCWEGFWTTRQLRRKAG
jgi:hypothetical protein